MSTAAFLSGALPLLPERPLPPHGNRRGEENRVRVCGGPFVDPKTLAQMEEWRAFASYGEQIDILVRDAQRRRFIPKSKGKYRARPSRARTR